MSTRRLSLLTNKVAFLLYVRSREAWKFAVQKCNPSAATGMYTTTKSTAEFGTRHYRVVVLRTNKQVPGT